MKVIVALLVILVGTCGIAGGTSIPQDAIPDEVAIANKHYQAALQHIEREQWQSACAELEQFIKIIPIEFSSHHLLARCAARLGKTDLALTELDAAVELGYEDLASVQAGDDFATLRNLETFQQIIEKAKRYREQEFVLVRPKGNNDADPEKRQIVLYFHGRGESPRATISLWRPIADELGLCVLIPKGTRPFGQVYIWDAEDARGNEPWKIDRTAAMDKATAALDWLRDEQHVECEALVLAGFSQGAVVALELASGERQHRLPADSLLLMSAALPGEYECELPATTPVAQFVGEQELWRDSNRSLRDKLERQQVKLRYHEHACGHDLPRPFAETMVPLLRDFLLPAADDAKANH